MAQEKLHVVPHNDGWAVKREGKNDVESTHPTQKEAIDAGRDLAQKGEVDLVIHRSDGTFRKIYTIGGEEEMSDRGNGREADRGVRGERIEAKDVVSVGTRISWGAILAGAAVALTFMIMMGVLGTAAGLTVRDRMSDQSYFIGAMICSLVTLLASFFLGGMVVSRITAGEDKTEAMTYGVVLWGVVFVALAVLSTIGANTGFNALAVHNDAKAALPNQFFDNLKSPLTPEQVDELHAKLRNAAPAISATQAAWWGFAGILLSILAAIAGSVSGAGPTLFLRQIRARRTQAAPPSVPVTQPALQTAGR